MGTTQATYTPDHLGGPDRVPARRRRGALLTLSASLASLAMACTVAATPAAAATDTVSPSPSPDAHDSISPTSAPTGATEPVTSRPASPEPSTTAATAEPQRGADAQTSSPPTPSAPPSTPPLAESSETSAPSASLPNVAPKAEPAAAAPFPVGSAAYSVASTALRAEPKAGAATLFTVVGGSHLTVTKTSAGWTQVRYGSVVGWAANVELSKTNPLSAKNYDAYARSTLQSRIHTNLDGRRGEIPAGSRLHVMGQARDWLKVRYNGTTGFVAPGSAVSTAAPSVAVADHSAWVHADRWLRADTTPEAKTLRLAGAGTDLHITQRRGAWSLARLGAVKGWILTADLHSRAPVRTVNYTRWAARDTTLWPHTNWDGSLGTIPIGARVKVSREIGGWVRVSYGSKTGFVLKSRELRTTIPVTSASSWHFTSKSVPVRASTARLPYDKALKTLPAGTKLKVTGRVGPWARVQYGATSGYVMYSGDLTKDNRNSVAVYGTLRLGKHNAYMMSGYAQRDLGPRLTRQALWLYLRSTTNAARDMTTITPSSTRAVIAEQYMYSAARARAKINALNTFESGFRVKGRQFYTKQFLPMTDGTRSYVWGTNPALVSYVQSVSTLVKSGDFDDRRRY